VVAGFTGKLAVSEGVPELDGLICSRGNDLSIIRGETAGKNFFSVSYEPLGSYSSSEVP